MSFASRILFSLLVLVFGLSLASSRSFAEEEPEINENPLTISSRFATSEIAPGGGTQLIIDLNLEAPFRAYLKMFKLVVNPESGIQVSPFQLAPIINFKDTFSGKMKSGVTGLSQMIAEIKIPATESEGKKSAKFELTYQACTDAVCLFPKKIPFEIGYKVTGSPVESQSESDSSSFEQALGKGKFYAFLFVFIAGLLTSLTPCIFPMIPITLSILGTRTAGQSRKRGFLLSLTYVLGIGFTYSLLGVAAAKTGALFGSALANPLVVGAIAAVFVIMGLSMYGLFEIQVPAFIRNKFGNKNTGSGFVGSFLAGLVAGVVASPCVGPVLVGVLAYVAQTQDSVLGFFLLFDFALGMGVLFMVLGTFGQALGYLPKAGGWMEGVKFVFGTTMIGMAFYYLRPILNPREFYLMAGAACVLISSGFGAFAPVVSTTPQQIKKGTLLTIFIVGVAFILSAVFERELRAINQTPVGASTKSPYQTSGVKWVPYTDSAFNEALSKRQPVIIDFWAEWCSACNELERYTFSDTRVQVEAENFLMLKIDATVSTPEIAKLQEYFKVMGLPTVLFYDNLGKLRKDLTLTGFENAEKFLVRMKKAHQTKN